MAMYLGPWYFDRSGIHMFGIIHYIVMVTINMLHNIWQYAMVLSCFLMLLIVWLNNKYPGTKHENHRFTGRDELGKHGIVLSMD